jgi:hypothetical protein
VSGPSALLVETLRTDITGIWTFVSVHTTVISSVPYETETTIRAAIIPKQASSTINSMVTLTNTRTVVVTFVSGISSLPPIDMGIQSSGVQTSDDPSNFFISSAAYFPPSAPTSMFSGDDSSDSGDQNSGLGDFGSAVSSPDHTAEFTNSPISNALSNEADIMSLSSNLAAAVSSLASSSAKMIPEDLTGISEFFEEAPTPSTAIG